MDDVIDGVENTMEDAGNAVSDTASDVAYGVKSGVNGVANTMGNIGSTVMDTMNMNEDNYTAERTATTGYTNEGTFLGLNSMAWTWIVIGVVAATIIGLVVYYNTQRNYGRNRSRNRDNY